MNIEQMVDRSATIRTIADPGKAVKQRIAKSADELNRAGELAKQLSVANEAIYKITELIYAPDTDGYFCNVDPKTGMIAIGQPWGRHGHKSYGLRQTEAILIRMVMLGRQKQLERMPAAERNTYPQLYYYSPDWRRWFANLDAYPTYERALEWLKNGPLTLQEWRIATDLQRQKRR